MKIKTCLLMLIMLAVSSCGMVKTVAISTTADILSEGSEEILTEKNWNVAKDGLPANLKMMEGMLYAKPQNKALLAALNKGYMAYGFAIHETEHMAHQYGNKKDDFHLKQSLINYSKSLAYGLRYFKEKGVELKDIMKAMRDDDGGVGFLNSKFSSSSVMDKEAVFYTASALGNLINLQKSNMSLMAQLPAVKKLMDWVCAEDQAMNHGACGMFNGMYDVSRPRMLGGNPENGKQVFLKTIKKYPYNYMARIAYIQYYLIPFEDLNGFKKQMQELSDGHREFMESQKWKPGKGLKLGKYKTVNIFNAIAFKRYEILKKYRKKLF